MQTFVSAHILPLGAEITVRWEGREGREPKNTGSSFIYRLLANERAMRNLIWRQSFVPGRKVSLNR